MKFYSRCVIINFICTGHGWQLIVSTRFKWEERINREKEGETKEIKNERERRKSREEEGKEKRESESMEERLGEQTRGELFILLPAVRIGQYVPSLRAHRLHTWIHEFQFLLFCLFFLRARSWRRRRRRRRRRR